MEVKFTEQEQKELAEAHAIRQRVKAARRARQIEYDTVTKVNEQKAKLAAAVKRKADFDARVRRLLLDFTYKMKQENVRLLDDQFKPYGTSYQNREKIAAFTVFDSAPNDVGTTLRSTVYWVYGKGFEWA